MYCRNSLVAILLSLLCLLGCVVCYDRGGRVVDEENEYYSSEWVITLQGGDDLSFLTELGFEVIDKIELSKTYYLVRHLETHARHQRQTHRELRASEFVTSLLLAHPRISYANQQIKTQYYPRYVFNDPLYGDQWHLENTGQYGGTPGEDIDVQPVWDKGYTGNGVQIAIVDDGYDYTHPDLSPKFDLASSHNYNTGNANDPAPGVETNFHGTACAGVSLAKNNTSCGVGAAFQASGAGIRLIGGAVGDAENAQAMKFANQKNDIYSNSWGPSDKGWVVADGGPMWKEAVALSSKTGRGGKGSIYTWAAGNGGEDMDNCNYDGKANYRYVIAVGAIGNNGKHSAYSEECAALIVVAPSSGGTAGITTTDLMGANGYSLTDCANDFGGTSSATPLVSGVIALMLEANPDLYPRDVAFILATTARKNDPTDTDWTNNGAGFHVNHKYGFGVVNANDAVNASISHIHLNAEVKVTASNLLLSMNIPDYNSTGITTVVHVVGQILIERAVITVTTDHLHAGDLQINITSPQGTNNVLASDHGNRTKFYFNNNNNNTQYDIGIATFGPPFAFGNLTGDAQVTQPDNACAAITNCPDLSGKIAYVKRDGSACSNTARAGRVQACGAIAMIIYEDYAAYGELIWPLKGTDPTITIPSGYLSYTAQTAFSRAGPSVTIARLKADNSGYATGWPFSSTRLLGEKSQGDWVINIADMYPADTGTLTAITIDIYGTEYIAPTISSVTPLGGPTTGEAVVVVVMLLKLLLI